MIYRLASVASLASIMTIACSQILIDDFEVGNLHVEITGTGNQVTQQINLDRDHVFAGERWTNYTVNSNPFGYTTSFDIDRGEARVTTPGPNDLSTELEFAYGLWQPMNLDLSWFQGQGRLFQIHLATNPRDLFAEVWDIFLTDGQGRATRNGQFGTIDGGIEFRKDGFVGNPDFDWADIDYFEFKHRYNRQNTAPLSYSTYGIWAVPEPGSAISYSLVAMFVVARARKRARAAFRVKR